MTKPVNKDAKPERIPFHEEFASKIINMLEEGTAPWQQPWQPGQNMAPRNPLSGTVYKGGNRLWLSLIEQAQGYDDPRWMTVKQANDAGYRVRQGEHGATIVFWQFTREQDRLDDAGRPILGADGKPEKETVELDRPIMRCARVFNAQQIENFPPLPKMEREFTWQPHEKAEAILHNSGAVIKHDQRDRAFYSIASDEIHLPSKNAFDQHDKYYATALHELGHWTRHPDRLNRDSGPFGSAAYAKEELRAEICSWMVGQDIGVGHDPGQHAAYVKSWIQALKEDPLEILRACRDAEKIRDYVMGLELQKEKELAQEKTVAASQEKQPAREKTWLAVPYSKKDIAKAHGARWDRQEKLWYAPEGTDLAPLRDFLNQQQAKSHDRGATLDPRAEFAAKLADLGLDLKGQLPELDGKTHRVPLLAKNGRGQDGAYCLYGDGVPAGWAQNHVTGEKVKLVATGVVLSHQELERQMNEQAEKLAAWEAERAREHDKAALRCAKLIADEFMPLTFPHPYLVAKGVLFPGGTTGTREESNAKRGLSVDPENKNLIIPFMNAAGETRGFQAISPEGVKAFASGVQKRGNFHLISGLMEGVNYSRDMLAKSKEILICEGFATGASLHMASGKPVAVAFDSGNLAPVAEALHKAYPHLKMTICADNDHALVRDGKPWNVGLEKARAAAERVGAKVLVPGLTAKEKAQGLTDFNDIHKSRGIAELKKQLGVRDLSRAQGRGHVREVGA